jgi:hypothetical protein
VGRHEAARQVASLVPEMGTNAGKEEPTSRTSTPRQVL